MNKVALVTGGSKGIGAAIVKELSKSGYKVIATYNTTTPKCKLDNVTYKKLDITDGEDCRKFIEELGEQSINVDILVNNAGVTKDAMFHKMKVEDWRSVLDVNLSSLYNLTQPVYTVMRERKYGRIINISSINANKGQIGQTNYCASKAGIQGFTKALAQEGARYGITVNSISPGYTNTSMVENIRADILEEIKKSIPMGRLCEVEEVASQVSYLASDKASYITGANIEINGGMYSS